MGEQSYFYRKFFSTKSKGSSMESPPTPSHQRAPPNGSASLRENSDSQSLEEPFDAPASKQARRHSMQFTLPIDEREQESQLRPIRQSATTHDIQDSNQEDRCHETGAQLQDANSTNLNDKSSRVLDVDVDFDVHVHVDGQNNSTIESEQVNKPAAYQLTRSITPPNDHIETLSFHPEAQSNNQDGESNSKKKKQSKLFRATKAILLFKRASSPQNAHTSPTSPARQHHSSAFKCSRSFVASFWRQPNTAQSSKTYAKSSRVHSFASSNTIHAKNPESSRSSITAFLTGSGSGSGSAGLSGDKSNSGTTPDTYGKDGADDKESSSSFSLPRFIVPRMNALKLPIVCLVRSLDGELMREIFIHRYELGQYLMDNLKISLGMKDSKYFGLKMVNSIDEQEDVQQPWLDLNESVYKQITKYNRVITVNKNADTSSSSEHQQHQSTSSSSTTTITTKSVNFYLRIKFYPPNLARIQDQFLKQYLWLQLRRDLRLGKLTSSMNNLTYLMACVLQYELGDYKQELVSERLPCFCVLPNQDLIEQQAIEIWQNKLKGTKKHLVLMQFLRASVILETYGFDYYPVRDHQRQRAYLLGFNYAGVKTIRNGRIINYFRWHNLSKISYERRMIIFHIYPNENSKRKQILGFKCLSNDECQNLYLRLLEQKYFFTVDLTYFDKSIRRPSHLTESSVGHQQLADWLSPTSDRQANLTTDYSFCDDEGLAEDEEEEEVTSEQTQRDVRSDEVSQTNIAPSRKQQSHDGEVDTSNLRRKKYQHRTNTDPSKNHVHDTSGGSSQLPSRNLTWQSNEPSFASSSQMSQPSDLVARSRALNIIKSTSLQEPSQYDPISCQQSELTNYFSQLGSPETVPDCIKDCCSNRGAYNVSSYSDECYQGASTSSAAHSSPKQASAKLSPPLLQRQCSILKYSPDYEHFNANEQSSLNEGITRSSPRATSTDDTNIEYLIGVPQQPVNDQDKRNASTSQRIVDWTERILVQPATIFAGSNDCWQTQQRHASQAIPQASQQQQQNVSTGNEIFIQGLRCCMLILLLNFLLKLSDGLSGILVDLFTFRAQPASSASSQHSSIFNSPSDS